MENQDRAFLEAIVRLADVNPDKVYGMPTPDGCDYVEFGQDDELVGSCLIGCALKEIGVPLEELKYYNSSFAKNNVPWPEWAEELHRYEVPTAASGVIESLNMRGLTNISGNAALTARDVQIDQDSHIPWGETARYARNALKVLN